MAMYITNIVPTYITFQPTEYHIFYICSDGSLHTRAFDKMTYDLYQKEINELLQTRQDATEFIKRIPQTDLEKYYRIVHDDFSHT